MANLGLALPACTATVGVHTSFPIHADLAHLSHDQALMNKIIKKRQDEVARRARLLDPRQRTGGTAHHVLAVQVAEKKAAAEAEAAEDMYHAAVGQTHAQVMHHLETMKVTMARDRQMATIDFNTQNLKKEDRSEFALSDPSALKREVLLSDEEFAQLGPSSFQNFAGQKGGSKEDKKETQQTMAFDLAMQVQMKSDRQREELEWNNHMDEQSMLANQVRHLCETNDAEEARNLKHEEVQINQVLAADQNARKMAKKRREEEERMKHLTTVVQQDKDRLKDDYKVCDNGKLVRTEYRRMTIQEEQDVYNTNAQLILDKKIRKQQEMAVEAAHAQQTLGCTAVLDAVAGMRSQMAKDRTIDFLADNAGLAAAKREKDVQERIAYKSYAPDY